MTRPDAIPPRPAAPDHAAPDHAARDHAAPDHAAAAHAQPSGPATPDRPARPDPAATPVITLRAMTRADLPAVLRLEESLFGDEAWSDAMLASELEGAEASGRYYLVAEDAGALVGYAGLLSPGGGQSDVLTMAVVQQRWGQQIGALLLDALLAEAARRAGTDVFLEVRVDNERAQRLYRSRGFVEIGIRRGYYQPSGTDALVMQLTLPRARRFGFSGARRSATKHGDPKPAAGGSR